MLRMEIEFDALKIQQENILQIEDLFLRLDQSIYQLRLRKIEDGVYQDGENKGDLTKFFAIIS